MPRSGIRYAATGKRTEEPPSEGNGGDPDEFVQCYFVQGSREQGGPSQTLCSAKVSGI